MLRVLARYENARLGMECPNLSFRFMAFHIDLKSLQLDPEISSRISAKISAVTLNEIAHMDLSEVTTVIGKLGPGIRGIIAIKDLNSLGELAGRQEFQNLE